MLLPLWRRELVATIWTHGVPGSDQAQALGALFGRRLAARARLDSLDANRIDRPVPQHVAAEVEDQAVFLPLAQSKPPPNHLVVETRR